MKRKTLLILLLLIILPITWIKAFEPAEQVPYSIEFDNGSIFIMTDNYGDEEKYIHNSSGFAYKQSGLYSDETSSEPMWTFNFYAYEHELFVLDDSVHFARVIKFPDYANSMQVGLIFYKSGESTQYFTVSRLISNFNNVTNLGTTYMWIDDAQLIDEALYLTTIDGRSYTFDMKNGEMKSKNNVQKEDTSNNEEDNTRTGKQMLIVGIILAGGAICFVSFYLFFRRKKKEK